tara:strand:- start:1539 stop:1757 length:219 start_codon:yes stop_codon:yes gene_type:complete
MVGETMKLSDQAVGAVMMALQKSLLEQSDIVPVIKGFEFVPAADNEGQEAELYVRNPPLVKLGNEETVEEDE